MTKITYYTVLTRRNAYMVKYATAPAGQVFTFPGLFDDPGNASREFKVAMQGDLEYLAPGVFERKVSDLRTRYQQDIAKLADWNSGKPIRV